jgi:hypothetical protein
MTENVNPLTNSVKCLAYPPVFEMTPVVCPSGLYNKYDVINKNENNYRQLACSLLYPCPTNAVKTAQKSATLKSAVANIRQPNFKFIFLTS